MEFNPKMTIENFNKQHFANECLMPPAVVDFTNYNIYSKQNRLPDLTVVLAINKITVMYRNIEFSLKCL